MAKSQLEFVTNNDSRHINVLLYGPPKSGKTVGASTAPGPILFLNADRPNATRFAHKLAKDRDDMIWEIQANGLETLIGVIEDLQRDDADYRSIVVDPVGELYRIVLEGLSGRALRPQIQMYGDTGTHIERFCRALCDAPINTVFVLHELRDRDEESGHYERLPYTGTKNPVFAAKLMAMVDVIGYTGVVREDGQEPRYLAQLIDGGGRRGGDRFGALGPVRDINIAEWVSLAEQAMALKAPKETS